MSKKIIIIISTIILAGIIIGLSVGLTVGKGKSEEEPKIGSLGILVDALKEVKDVNDSYKESPELTDSMTKELRNFDYITKPFKNLRIQGMDESGSFLVIVDVQLGFELSNEFLAEEIIEKAEDLENVIRKFFSSQTQEQLSPRNEAKIKNDLKSRINQLLDKGQVDVVLLNNFFRMAQ